MSPIAGQTAGPNELKLFVDTGGCLRLKNLNLKKLFLYLKKKLPRTTPDRSDSPKY